MKKIIFLTLCLAVILSLTACANKANDIPTTVPVDTTESVVETEPETVETEPVVTTEPTVATQTFEATTIANPWQDQVSLEDACAYVGFDMEIPEFIEGYDTVSYSTCSNTLLQITYYKLVDVPEENLDNYKIVVRKSVGGADNSGDWNNYLINIIADIDDYQASIKGDKENMYIATWYHDGYSYSISYQMGTSEETFEELIAAIK